jgi:hypothetical protein
VGTSGGQSPAVTRPRRQRLPEGVSGSHVLYVAELPAVRAKPMKERSGGGDQRLSECLQPAILGRQLPAAGGVASVPSAINDDTEWSEWR